MLSIIPALIRLRRVQACAISLVLSLAGYACDKLPLLAPQESTITLSSTSSVVQANGTTEIRATVLEQGGTPVQNGTTVSFTTNLGVISPNDARTINGVAVAQFSGNGNSGRAQIRAISGGAASETLELAVGAAAAGRVSVTANPTSVSASGGTSTISALVTDESGNPLGGVPVSFATTAGTFSASVVNTDFGGTARTTLTTNRESSVTATAGGVTSTAVTISITARPVVSIALASGSTPIEGGITTFTITANPATGGGPIEQVTVNFGDGDTRSLGTSVGTFSVQHVYQSDGTFTPTVTVTDSAGITASASTVIVVQPLLVSLSTSKSGNTVTFTATPSPAGVAVGSYTWTFGDGTSSTTTSNTVQHTYAPGTYTAQVVVRTATNTTAQSSTSVTVP